MPYWDRMPYKQYRLAQEQRLARYIREQVYPYSAFYRTLFDERGIKPESIRTLDDLQSLPFTTKADISPSEADPERPRKLILDPQTEVDGRKARGARARERWLRWTRGKRGYEYLVDDEYKPVHLHFTTGRTALPTPVFYTASDLCRVRQCAQRISQLSRLEDRELLINAFPYAPHLAFWMTYFTCEATHTPALHTGGGRILGTERILSAIQRLGGCVLAGTPGYVYHLLREARDNGLQLPTLHTLVLGAERVSPAQRARLASLAPDLGIENLSVLATYAFTEGRIAWPECRPPEMAGAAPSLGYHLFPDMEIIELVDPETGHPVGAGEDGEIIYTSLDWRGTALLRFRTGDLARGGISYEPCPNCKRLTPRLSGDIVRLSDYKEFELTKLKGTLIDLNAFYPILSGYKDILEWQLEIRKANNDPFDLDELHLYLAPTEGASKNKIKEEVASRIQRELEITPTKISFTNLPKLLKQLGMETESKELRIIDRRPSA